MLASGRPFGSGRGKYARRIHLEFTLQEIRRLRRSTG